jgi:hypothetical protein
MSLRVDRVAKRFLANYRALIQWGLAVICNRISCWCIAGDATVTAATGPDAFGGQA